VAKKESIIYESCINNNYCLKIRFEDIFCEDPSGIKKIIEFIRIKNSLNNEEIMSLIKKKIYFSERYVLPQWKSWSEDLK